MKKLRIKKTKVVTKRAAEKRCTESIIESLLEDVRLAAGGIRQRAY
jgi:hypothetical protein